jgi:hypothetical protein
MKFVTWNLRPIADGYLDGPEETIVQRGGSAIAIWIDGSPENGASILGKVSGDTSGLEEWNVTEISKSEAEAFIEQNFTPYVGEDGVERTLADVIGVLD